VLGKVNKEMDVTMGKDTCINSNTLYRSISDVVSNQWNPMDLAESDTTNRYEQYIPVIYNWALAANDQEDLVQDLSRLACSQWGLATNHHNDWRAAHLIIAIRDFHLNNADYLSPQLPLKLGA
jgi:hypothetical protein